MKVITTEQIGELEKRILGNDIEAQKELDRLRKEQPFLFEWIAHHFTYSNKIAALYGVTMAAMILLNGNGSSFEEMVKYDH